MKACRHDILHFLFLLWDTKFFTWVYYKYTTNCVQNIVDKLEIISHVIGLIY